MSRSRRCPISPKTLPSSDSKIGEDDDIDEVTTRGERENDADVDDRWSSMLPELLTEIIKRVEASEDKWPMRKSVVACACVCKRWRQTTMEIVRPPVECGRITFPSHLKQSATREAPVQCFIKRNAKNSTFLLYLSLTAQIKNLASTGVGKFLLAAKRTRRGGRFEYVISLDADDFSQGSNAYLGKLRSDFLGTKFTVYDSRPPFEGAKASSRRASRRFSFKQVSPSPQVSAGNFEIGNLSYKFNILKSRGPRRMACSLQVPPNPESSPTINDILNKSNTKSPICNSFTPSSLVLKNKAPRWHEHLQCWCLNFHGRVTVASVKNFQLVASVDPSQPGNVGDEETVLLQFGKVGDDLFTMDYRQPLSAFQAFALCLTSFGTKFGCE